MLLSDHWNASNEIDNVMSESEYMSLDEDDERDDNPMDHMVLNVTEGQDIDLDADIEFELEWEPYKKVPLQVHHFQYSSTSST